MKTRAVAGGEGLNHVKVYLNQMLDIDGTNAKLNVDYKRATPDFQTGIRGGFEAELKEAFELSFA